MATVTFQGAPVETAGSLPSAGAKAPDFCLVKGDLSEANLASFAGKKVVLNIFPSIDTEVCAASVRKFNEEAANCENTEVVCVSVDLPFAQGRFCGAEGIENVTSVSAFRSPEFGEEYGVVITDGALKGLLARGVVVLDTEGNVTYTELVSEITNEPDYESALKAL